MAGEVLPIRPDSKDPLPGFNGLPAAINRGSDLTHEPQPSLDIITGNVATLTTRPPRRRLSPVFGGVLYWRSLAERKEEKFSSRGNRTHDFVNSGQARWPLGYPATLRSGETWAIIKTGILSSFIAYLPHLWPKYLERIYYHSSFKSREFFEIIQPQQMETTEQVLFLSVYTKISWVLQATVVCGEIRVC